MRKAKFNSRKHSNNRTIKHSNNSKRCGHKPKELDAFLEKLHDLRDELGRRVDSNNPGNDLPLTMRVYGFPKSFAKDVQRDAKKVTAWAKDTKGRLDLRKKFIFTCDPETARDYDDALSIEKDAEGHRVLGVHIADVSHFVRPNSALDKEAAKRSNSVYLTGKVVPMLPEELSNGVCSLVPNEDRLAFSCFLTYDAKGRCIARRFAKSVICSKARFAYSQVLKLLTAKNATAARKVLGGKKLLSANVVRDIKAIAKLAQQLRANRFAAGALDIELPEAEILLDVNGMMQGIALRDYDESHQMVEECMVAANEAVATELWTRGIRIPARFHEAPDPEKIEELRANLAAVGVSCGDISEPRIFSNLLKIIKKHPLKDTLGVMVLRAMKRAIYTPADIGHWGLAKKYYAHFTSPIRRYPDLVLHRQLAAFLNGEGGKLNKTYLAKISKYASECEQIADDAERALVEIKKYRYLEAHLGETYEAVVSKCMKFGMFVDIPSLAVGGLVHISKVSADYARYDAFRDEIRAGNNVWRVGDKVNVRVIKTDIARRLIDFEIISKPRKMLFV